MSIANVLQFLGTPVQGPSSSWVQGNKNWNLQQAEDFLSKQKISIKKKDKPIEYFEANKSHFEWRLVQKHIKVLRLIHADDEKINLKFQLYSFLKEKYKIEYHKNDQEKKDNYETENYYLLSYTWAVYIEALKKENKIDADALSRIFKVLDKKVVYRELVHSCTNINGAKRVKYKRKSREKDDSKYTGKLEFNSKGDLVINGDVYRYNNRESTNLNPLELVCTLLSMKLGFMHSQSLTMKQEKTAIGKDKLIKLKQLPNVITTLCGWKDIDKHLGLVYKKPEEDSEYIISFVNIIKWMNNPENKLKVENDMRLGASLSKKFNINDMLKKQHIVINLDHNELRVLSSCNKKKLFENKHVSLPNGVSSAKLRTIYGLYGECYNPTGTNSNFKHIGSFELLVYMIFSNYGKPQNNKFKKSKSLLPTELVVCLNSIADYFRTKDNHFERKQEWFSRSTGNPYEVVEYYNRINRNTPMDIDLVDFSDVSPEQIKSETFRLFFINPKEPLDKQLLSI